MSEPCDIYRDSGLRYLGYSNEVGEAFRPLIKRSLVHGSYLLASAYVCADTIDKSLKKHRISKSLKETAIVAGDVFTWQMVASVIVPGFTINRLTWMTAKLLKIAKARKIFVKTLPTAIGLCSIPFIIHPIDKFADQLMDLTYRKWIN